MRVLAVTALLLGLVLFAGCSGEASVADAADEPQAETPEEFFERYAALEEASNVAVADLYADYASIKVTFIDSTGGRYAATIPAARVKRIIRNLYPLLQQEREREGTEYTDVSCTPEGGGYRIEAVSLSDAGKENTQSILINRDMNGDWIIVEDISEVHTEHAQFLAELLR